jgi:hypothetical protein
VKIRGLAELNQALNEEISWRKKEIVSLRLMINKAREHEKSALRRCAIPILYAHWEGFTKFAAECYLDLVWRQRLPYSQLKGNFLALACRTSMSDLGNNTRIKAHLGVVEFVLFNQGNQAEFTRSISADSNLNSAVLQDILAEIGLKCDQDYSVKLLFLDASLLKNRNDIAHGRKIEVDDVTYNEIHKNVMELLDHTLNSIENAAVQKTYLR